MLRLIDRRVTQGAFVAVIQAEPLRKADPDGEERERPERGPDVAPSDESGSKTCRRGGGDVRPGEHATEKRIARCR